MQKVSKSLKETESIAQEFLANLKPGKEKATIIGLYGDLGVGKTAFTQAVAKGLGIKRKVNSPTYVIIKKYKLNKNASRENFLASKTKPVLAGENFRARHSFGKLFHMDAYRLKNEKELIHLGWDEILSNKEHLVFIEWPENIIKALPQKHHQVHISHLPRRSDTKAGAKEGHRKFKIS